LGGITPHQSVLYDIDNARDDLAIIDPWNAMRKREKRLDPAHLRLTQQERNIQFQRLLDTDVESIPHRRCKQFNGS
jgi:hypothetical protein